MIRRPPKEESPFVLPERTVARYAFLPQTLTDGTWIWLEKYTTAEIFVPKMGGWKTYRSYLPESK